MAIEFKDIVQALQDDPEFRNELMRCSNADEAVAVATRLVKKQGYDVTPNELKQSFFPPDGELSDSQLETVVGGKRDSSKSEDIAGDGSLFAQFLFLVGNHTSSAYDDEIDGGGGDDTLWGGYGNDTVKGGSGNDSMDGGYGANDTIDGGDSMEGGEGNDTMWGGLGEDEMYGEADNDYMHGNEDNDSVYGGDGNDEVYGDEGDDVVHGDAGNDRVYGDEGDDELYGDDGNDTLDGGSGNDVLTGGTGSDIFVFGKDSGTDTITDFDPDHDKFRFEECSKASEIDVAAAGGKTFITYGDTTIIVEGVEMTAGEVWNRSE